MRHVVLARVVLTGIAVAIWGYGYRYDVASVRLAAIGILVVSLLLRFAPAHWFGDRR